MCFLCILPYEKDVSVEFVARGGVNVGFVDYFFLVSFVVCGK